MLEQQIYSIESANINQETLVAMKNAGAAMKQIHGKMTMEDVDVTMYVQEIFIYMQAAAGRFAMPWFCIIFSCYSLAARPLFSAPEHFQSYPCSRD